MLLGWGCKHFSLGPKTSVAQAQHFVSNPTNILVPSRSLYNGFCIFSLPKGSRRICCNTMSVLPALAVPPVIISSGWDSLAWCHSSQGSSYQCNRNTQLQHSLHCSLWYFASRASGFPLPFSPLPPGHSYHLTLSQTSPWDREGNNTAYSKSARPGCCVMAAFIYLLYICYFLLFFFFFALYPPFPQITVIPLCSFPQQFQDGESTALTTAKGRRTRGIQWSVIEAKTSSFSYSGI